MKKDLVIQKLVKIAKAQQFLLKELTKTSAYEMNAGKQQFERCDRIFDMFYDKILKQVDIENNKDQEDNASTKIVNEDLKNLRRTISEKIQSENQLEFQLKSSIDFINKYSAQFKILDECHPFAKWFFSTYIERFGHEPTWTNMQKIFKKLWDL